MARRRNKNEERGIAKRRVVGLIRRARDEAVGPDADLADRYADLACRVARRYQQPLPRDVKAQVCRRCRAYRHGTTTRVRLRAGRLTITCLRCGDIRRRPLGTP